MPTEPSAAAAAVTTVIDSGPSCNNACHGCPRRLTPGSEAPCPPALELPAGTSGPVVLHGGEPTLHPDFLELLSRCRDAGRPLLLSTNGRAFAVAGRAAQARKAGLAAVEVSLWGGREASHDFLTGVPGSFRQAVAGVTHLRVAGVRLTLRLLLTRSSLAELPVMTTLALGLGAQAVRFSLARIEPRPGGFALAPRAALVEDVADPKGPLRVDRNTPAGDRAGYDEHREWLVPRLSLVREPLGTAAAVVVRHGRAALVDGVPLCLAPANVALSAAPPGCLLPSPGAAEPVAAPGEPAAIDTYAAPCQSCAARGRCPGVPRGYLSRFGPSELTPLPD